MWLTWPSTDTCFIELCATIIAVAKLQRQRTLCSGCQKIAENSNNNNNLKRVTRIVTETNKFIVSNNQCKDRTALTVHHQKSVLWYLIESGGWQSDTVKNNSENRSLLSFPTQAMQIFMWYCMVSRKRGSKHFQGNILFQQTFLQLLKANLSPILWSEQNKNNTGM